MDRQTRHEYDRLIAVFARALERVRSASDEQEELESWRLVQAAGWELNALLPRQESAARWTGSAKKGAGS